MLQKLIALGRYGGHTDKHMQKKIGQVHGG